MAITRMDDKLNIQKKLSQNKNTYSHKIKQKVIQSTESHKEMA